MNKFNSSRIVLVLLLVLGLGLLVASIYFGAQAGPAFAQDKKPTLVPAELLTPAPTPEDGRQVAILTLVIESGEDGAVKGVQLELGRIINSYAPNVWGRPGEWTVELVGQEKRQYGILDPRRLEYYDSEKGQFAQEFQFHVVTDLVIPLYDDKLDLGVTTINIYDQLGNLIFSTEVDREGWAKQ